LSVATYQAADHKRRGILTYVIHLTHEEAEALQQQGFTLERRSKPKITADEEDAPSSDEEAATDDE
jgi:hypothetical protein